MNALCLVYCLSVTPSNFESRTTNHEPRFCLEPRVFICMRGKIHTLCDARGSMPDARIWVRASGLWPRASILDTDNLLTGCLLQPVHDGQAQTTFIDTFCQDNINTLVVT